MGKSLFRFLLLFVIVLTSGYCIHIGSINLFSLNRNMAIINVSYIFNAVFTILLTSGIILVSKKFKDQLGFIFMAGSLVKIGAFLVVINLYNFETNKNVFLDFFVAYVICLILEVYYVSRILNSDK